MQTRRFVYVLDPVLSDDVISGQNQNIQLVCVESGVKFIFGTFSAQFKFNNNVEQRR